MVSFALWHTFGTEQTHISFAFTLSTELVYRKFPENKKEIEKKTKVLKTAADI